MSLHEKENGFFPFNQSLSSASAKVASILLRFGGSLATALTVSSASTLMLVVASLTRLSLLNWYQSPINIEVNQIQILFIAYAAVLQRWTLFLYFCLKHFVMSK